MLMFDEPGAVVPCVVRHFDAVEISNGNWTYYLNRQRLVTTIALMELSHLQRDKSIAALLYEEYPDLTPFLVQNYINAAHACFIYQVTP